MPQILASQLQADLKAIAQAHIRAKGVLTRTFTLNVYSSADSSATYWLTKKLTYDFRNIVIGSIPAPTAVELGQTITPDTVFRMKNWVINNMVTQFKNVIGAGRTINTTDLSSDGAISRWTGSSIGSVAGFSPNGLDMSGNLTRINNLGSVGAWVSVSSSGVFSGSSMLAVGWGLISSGNSIRYHSGGTWATFDLNTKTFSGGPNYTTNGWTMWMYVSGGMIQSENAPWVTLV